MKSLKYLNKYFWQYKWHVISGILFIILSNLFAIYPAQIIRQSFDMVKNTIEQYQQLSGFDIQSEYFTHLTQIVMYYAGLVLLAAILKGVFLFFTRQTIIIMSRRVEFDMKNELFQHYQSLDLSFYKRNNTGDLMNRISEDVSKVRMYFGPAVMYFMNMVILFIMVIVTMLSINVELTLYVLAPLPILSVSIYYISNIINKKSERVQEELSNMSSFVQEAISGIRVIKSYTREEARSKEFDKETNQYKTTNLSLVKTNAMFMPLMTILIGLSTIITIYIGGILVDAGKISTGNIAEFVIYVNMLTWPVAALGWVTSITQRAAASQKRINEFLLTEPTIKNLHSEKSEIKGKIEFKEVSFHYPGHTTNVLDGVSFTVPKGTSLAIIGKTGSGKSTIANLISRLYDVEDGAILIDDAPVKHLNLHDLRYSIGYVPQDVFLFSESIYNNIAFGLSEKGDEDKVIQAAKMAKVHENIMDFPEQYQTVVGERGVTLSGGQKQRVSIARAIIKQPNILIFDDCLSAVDMETEHDILQNLKMQMKDRTAVIISHRVSSAMQCDQIIVLDEGKIAQRGNHQELVNQEGIYKELYTQQFPNEEI